MKKYFLLLDISGDPMRCHDPRVGKILLIKLNYISSLCFFTVWNWQLFDYTCISGIPIFFMTHSCDKYQLPDEKGSWDSLNAFLKKKWLWLLAYMYRTRLTHMVAQNELWLHRSWSFFTSTLRRSIYLSIWSNLFTQYVPVEINYVQSLQVIHYMYANKS